MTTFFPGKKISCPYCNKEFSLIENKMDDGIQPYPGVIALCGNCAEYMKYNNEMYLEKATDHDLVKLYRNDPKMYFQLQFMKARLKLKGRDLKGAIRKVIDSKRCDACGDKATNKDVRGNHIYYSCDICFMLTTKKYLELVKSINV